MAQVVTIEKGTDGQAQAVHPTFGPIKAFVQIPEEGGETVRLIDTQVATLNSLLEYVKSMGSELVGNRDSRLVQENIIRDIRSTLNGDIRNYLLQTSTGSDKVSQKLDDLILRVSQLGDRITSVQGVLEGIRTITSSINNQMAGITNQMTGISAQISNQTAILDGVKTPTAYMLTLTATDRPTSQALPANTRRLSFGARKNNLGVYPDLLYGFKTDDKLLLPDGARFYEQGINLSNTSLFLTPTVANSIVDVLAWA
jgi:hypothetical protein